MDEQSNSPPQDVRSPELSDSGADAIGERLCSDLVDRWQRGERVPVEAYLRQHPELESDDAVFELVLTEVVLRQSIGEPAPLDEYRWRFPQFDERLARHFTLHSGLASSQVSSFVGSDTATEFTPVVPPTVPGYDILGELGRGGMGIVYEARDTQLDRQVALKFLPLEYADDRARLERFRREARTASALNHPHICTVHALGEHQGRPFIVMELIEGFTLQTLLLRLLEIEEAARMFGQAAQALAAAHAEGVVHRDIKPENIMVRDDGYVKVLDFGLARRLPTLSPQAAVVERDTDPGALLGTVGYMSPEQTNGLPADSASDVFSLGVVLYQTLTGRHPFEADSALATLHAIVKSQPVPPSRLRPEIPKALEALIEAMLHKDGRLRPTAADVATALQTLARGGGPRVVRSASRPIVHRERELDALRAALHEADAGCGSLICVAGEPGIGKTTLVEGFLDELTKSDRECMVARGRCSERLAGTEAYLPVLDALGDLLRADASGSAARLMKIVAPTWYAQISRAAHAASAMTEYDLSRAASQQAMLREFYGFLEEASRLGPVVLFFDDVHWADLSTVDLLAHFGRLCRELRVLAVVTYRPTELLLGPHPFHRVRQELQARGACSEISVSFLGRQDVGRFLSLAFPNHDFPEDFADLIFGRTEGSPLFMADLLRDLQSRGVIAESNGRWALARALPDLQQDLPESVRSMIQRKLDRLQPEERRLLAAASVQGHEFDSAVVADALQQQAADVEERLQALERIHGLVRRIRECEFPDRTLTVRYAFVHILYQQALYGEISPSRRAALSAALAAALERRQGDGTSAAAELACLYEVGRDFARSARQFHRAAQNAAYVFAHHEAVELARRGLRLLQSVPDSAERNTLELKLQTTLGMQLQVTDGFAAREARQAYRRARELCRDAADSAPLFPVLWGLWLYSKVRSELARAQDMANELRDLSHQLQDLDLVLQSHQALGMTAFCRGLQTEAVHHVEQVTALYDAERHRTHSFMFGQDPAVICKGYGAVALWLLGYADQAERQSEEAIRMSRGLSPTSQAVALHFAAMLHQLRRDAPRVLACAEESTSIAVEHGFSFWLAGGNVLCGWALAVNGAADEGVELLQRGLRDWMATDSVTYQTYFLGLLGEVLHGLRRTDEGLLVIEEALALVEQTGERLYEAELRRVRGELLLMQSGAAEAEQCFQHALAVARDQHAIGLELRAAVSAARLARGRGRTGEARGILESVLHSVNEGFETPDYREASVFFEGFRAESDG
jgi:predicted ATPase